MSRQLCLVLVLLHSTPASAEWLCMPLADFNQHIADTGQSTTQLELTYGLTGVDPDDYFGTKGMIADLDDSSCASSTSPARATTTTTRPRLRGTTTMEGAGRAAVAAA